jgi:thioredoxin reductase (NADPH)
VPFDDLVDLDGLIGGLESRRSGRAQNRQDQTSKQHESHLQSGFRTGKALPLETSAPGVFAAGDIRAGAMNRVASAMGEGSMVVRFVHEYLALT